MAQQIANNNLLLDSFTSAQTTYADTSVTNFDNLLDVANKTLEKNNLLNSTTTSTSAENSKTTTSINTNVTSDNNTIKTDISNTNVKKDTNTQSVSYDKTENTTVVTNDVNSTDTVADTDKDKTVQNSEFSQDSDTSVNTEDINNSLILDVISRYTYLETDTENIIETDIDTNQETEECINIEDILLTTDEDINVADIENTDTTNSITNTQAAISIADLQTTNNTDTDANTTEDTVNINVSEEVSLNDEIQFVNNKNIGKGLISQKMVDELNVTIEEISSNTETEDMFTEPALMDSTEQTIKYMMDKETEKVSTITAEDKIETNTVDSKKVVLKEDTNIIEDSEIAEDLITESDVKEDIKLADNSDKFSNIKDSQDTEEVIDTDTEIDSFEEENTDTYNSSDFDSNSEGNNNQDKSTEDYTDNSKSDSKKQVFTSGFSEDIEAVSSEQTDSDITTVESVSFSKGQTQNISSAATNTQTITSNNHNISKEDVLAQIHSKLQTMNSTNNSRITMVLNPEALGKVSIQLVNTSDGLSAEMQVASQAVKDILDSNLSNLKETLSAQGVSVNEISVKVSQSENNAEMDYTEQENNNDNKQGQDKNQREEKDKQKFEKMFTMFQDNDEQEAEG